jgi:putative PIN family toxin of toxin-antitoxin system
LRAVIDTNIWVSGLLIPHGAPAQVRTLYLQGAFTLVTSEPLNWELIEVLSRPRIMQRYHVTPDEIGALHAFISRWSYMVEIPGELEICRDPKDNMVIETAVHGAADVVVTGDDDLLKMPEVIEYLSASGIQVVTARQFLQLLQPEPPPPATP